MDATTRQTLRDEALRSLRGYLATGCRYAGLLQKALDRLQLLGINTGGCEGSEQGLRHLEQHVIRYV